MKKRKAHMQQADIVLHPQIMLDHSQSIHDTIVAPATAPGHAAIAIVRLSGSNAHQIVRKLAPQLSNSVKPSQARRVTLYREHIALDDALLLEMVGPHSYTGENVAELHIHGNNALCQEITELCIFYGARMAEKGEFTFRAFLNGKLDLSQAEAVADLIHSTDKEQRQSAVLHLQGELSNQIHAILHQAEGILAGWRAAIDFPEYETQDGIALQGQGYELEQITDLLLRIRQRVQVRSQKQRQVVLCGAPNVGKSTLLNAIEGSERALVDAEPGTTRDPIEVHLNYRGNHISLWDTAGIRETNQPLEAKGISRTWEKIRDADVVIWLAASDAPVFPPEHLSAMIVFTKADLVSDVERRALKDKAALYAQPIWGFLSTRTQEGFTEFETLLFGEAHSSEEQQIFLRQRLYECLLRALHHLQVCCEHLKQGQTLDVISKELEEAVHYLGRYLGKDVEASVLDRIFSDFCIGK